MAVILYWHWLNPRVLFFKMFVWLGSIQIHVHFIDSRLLLLYLSTLKLVKCTQLQRVGLYLGVGFNWQWWPILCKHARFHLLLPLSDSVVNFNNWAIAQSRVILEVDVIQLAKWITYLNQNCWFQGKKMFSCCFSSKIWSNFQNSCITNIQR